MPLYSYECSRCKQVFEVLQDSADHYEDECPECKGKLERQFPIANFKFK